VEKYLKAFLQESRLIIPRIHDLLRLLDLVLPHHPSLRSLRSRLRVLQRFAVDIRYPGFSANAGQSRRAVQVAETVRAEIRRRLGLRRRPPLS
jgi:HEPN domain-containing protein